MNWLSVSSSSVPGRQQRFSSCLLLSNLQFHSESNRLEICGSFFFWFRIVNISESIKRKAFFFVQVLSLPAWIWQDMEGKIEGLLLR